jgi:outer membrane protein TolC
LDAIDVLYDASLAYFEWKKSDQEVRLYTQYVQNATVRYGAIKTLIIQGDKPGIDSIEAGINVRNRKLNLSEAQLKRTKAKLELANFLWLDNLIPMELQDDIVPEVNLENTIQNTLGTTEILTANIDIEQHPKIAALNQKRSLLDIDRKLKANMLLPKADVGYQYLSEDRYRNTPFENNYKLGMNVNFPLFLRKERGNLKLAKLKVQDVQWEISLERVQLSNKIKGQQAAVKTMEEQKNMAKQLTQDYQTMLRAEERLFGLGESSFFILNMRENNLVSAQITAIQLENSYFQSNAKLYQTTAQTQTK